MSASTTTLSRLPAVLGNIRFEYALDVVCQRAAVGFGSALQFELQARCDPKADCDGLGLLWFVGHVVHRSRSFLDVVSRIG